MNSETEVQRNAETFELFLPGRLCLFGEHSDWAGGLRRRDERIAPGACILTGTDQGIWAKTYACDAFELVSRTPDGEVHSPFRIPLDGDVLLQAAENGGFFRYAAGVALEVWRRYRAPGVKICIDRMDLPVARGLSSSAAVCVLIARAFNRIHHLGLDVREEMDLAYCGELAAGSKCGRMDQACAYGQRLLRIGFDADDMSIEVLRPSAALHLLIVDLCAEKDTRRILSDLQSQFLGGPESPRLSLRHALGASNLELIQRARTALEASDAVAVGALMSEAQERFDADVAPACPDELASPRLHALLADPVVRDLTCGGKGVGSQGDGSAQFVCRGEDERRELARALSETRNLPTLPLTIRPA